MTVQDISINSKTTTITIKRKKKFKTISKQLKSLKINFLFENKITETGNKITKGKMTKHEK